MLHPADRRILELATNATAYLETKFANHATRAQKAHQALGNPELNIKAPSPLAASLCSQAEIAAHIAGAAAQALELLRNIQRQTEPA